MNTILLALLTAFLFHGSAHAADKIRIVLPNVSGTFMTFPLAQKRGFLKEERLDAEIIRVTGRASSTALSNGEVDYGTGMTLGPEITGIPIRVVACYVPAPVNVLVARPEVKSVPELSGKTVGVSGIGGVSHFAARVIAKHFGLNPDRDLKFIAVGPVDARFARLTQGLVDAALLSPPLDSEAKKNGFNILARAEDVLIFPETGLVTAMKKIREKPDEIKRVIRAGIKANRYIRDNREGTIQFLIEWLKINREVATATYDSVVKVFDEDINKCQEGLRTVIEETRKNLKVNREVPLSDVADLSIFREAQKELGIKAK